MPINLRPDDARVSVYSEPCLSNTVASREVAYLKSFAIRFEYGMSGNNPRTRSQTASGRLRTAAGAILDAADLLDHQQQQPETSTRRRRAPATRRTRRSAAESAPPPPSRGPDLRQRSRARRRRPVIDEQSSSSSESFVERESSDDQSDRSWHESQASNSAETQSTTATADSSTSVRSTRDTEEQSNANSDLEIAEELVELQNDLEEEESLESSGSSDIFDDDIEPDIDFNPNPEFHIRLRDLAGFDDEDPYDSDYEPYGFSPYRRPYSPWFVNQVDPDELNPIEDPDDEPVAVFIGPGRRILLHPNVEQPNREPSDTISNSSDDLQVIEPMPLLAEIPQNPPSSPSRGARRTHDGNESSDSDEVHIRRPKKRRITDLDSQDGDSPKPSTSAAPALGVENANPDDLNESRNLDDGCLICYESYTNAGRHRLVSLKCGHFFGKSCIERWIQAEGRAAQCPTCKAKTKCGDIRVHFAQTVKLVDTSELEQIRVANGELIRKVAEIELELSRREMEVSDLKRQLREGRKAPEIAPTRIRGKMLLSANTSFSLTTSDKGHSRAFDFNGEYFAVGVHSPAGNMFKPFAIRVIGWNVNSGFHGGHSVPMHLNRSRVVEFSPFESSTILSGGEDKRAAVHTLTIGGNSTIKMEWRVPGDKAVWTGCWTAPDKVALGTVDGRIWEFGIGSPHPLRDLSGGIGHTPILFLACDPASGAVLSASSKNVIAFRGEGVFPLLCAERDGFTTIRSIAWDPRSLSFVTTLAPGSRHSCISHRLYRLEMNNDTDVGCVELESWNTTAVKSSTLWTNLVFSMEKGVFSVVFNEDDRCLMVHDWSSKRSDVMMKFTSPLNIVTMRSVPHKEENDRYIIILTEKALFSVTLRVVD